jgi:hypothetical protein
VLEAPEEVTDASQAPPDAVQSIAGAAKHPIPARPVATAKRGFTQP